MRKAKIINIDGLGEVTVKEVSPFAVYKAITAKNKLQEMQTLIGECVVLPQGKGNVTELYASEIEQIVDAFLEVNGSFLAIVGKLRLETYLVATGKAIADEMSKILPAAYAASYRLVMAKLPGITAGAAS